MTDRRVAILGAGSWGTALGLLCLDAGHPVRLWGRRAELVDQIRVGASPHFLPGIELPPELSATTDMAEAMDGASFIILAVPTGAVRGLSEQIADANIDVPVVCVAKGLEKGSGQRMSEVMAEVFGETIPQLVLLGPSHAEEVALRQPTAVVLSEATMESTATDLQSALSTSYFRIYTNEDCVGVELAAALKNVLAIAAGILDGLGLGDNTKGALLTRGVSEMARLGTAMGGQRETFYGLSGVGDLITTALSRHSRNRALGERIGKGMSLPDALESIGQVVEGAETSRSVVQLAKARGLSMPICEQVEEVLYQNKSPRDAIEDLMTRALRAETEH